ncbi:MAG: alpha/beta fold hydrolase [Pseudomonadota bacterium]
MRPVRFATTTDGRSLAWTRSGDGPPLVKASNWLTHLEYDAESPVWAHWIAFLEGHFDYTRYDERGCGLSDRDPGTLDLATWTDDLARVVEAAKVPEPFVLLGMSQGAGAALSFAARYPERVSHIVLFGGYVRGAYRRGDARAAELYRSVTDVFQAGFDLPNPAFREVFTRRFLPHGTPEQIGWFNDLCRKATSPDVGAQLLTARGNLDASNVLPHIKAPTLVMHAHGDEVVPVSEARFIAQGVPGAELVMLDSPNHVLQADEPAWAEVTRQILAFTGQPAVDDLTPRERDILTLICDAQSNKAIARALDVSEKTVRNHATNLFAKMGVSTRQEAILKARKGVR